MTDLGLRGFGLNQPAAAFVQRPKILNEPSDQGLYVKLVFELHSLISTCALEDDT